MDPIREARIRDLNRRIAQDPTSPLFMALAEEHRAAGRLDEAIRILEKGVGTHARYLSAQVALGRAYREAGRIEESLSLFVKALESDPGNLVAARSLAEVYLSRGDRVEAIKRYKLYHALSRDRAVEEIIERLETEIGPAPPPASDAQGRVLADLYFDQGHYKEAFAAYEGLSSAHPSDAGLARRKSEAAARLAAATPSSPPAPEANSDPDASRRDARIEALKRWLGSLGHHRGSRIQ
jgi:tetratricopeptide (TPR) repeat protein